MTPNTAAGAINRAKQIFLYVDYNTDADPMWLEISKAKAKEIVNEARDKGVTDVAVHVTRGKVFIGDPEDFQPRSTSALRNEEEEE